jgi:hypothetical protein
VNDAAGADELPSDEEVSRAIIDLFRALLQERNALRADARTLGADLEAAV